MIKKYLSKIIDRKVEERMAGMAEKIKDDCVNDLLSVLSDRSFWLTHYSDTMFRYGDCKSSDVVSIGIILRSAIKQIFAESLAESLDKSVKEKTDVALSDMNKSISSESFIDQIVDRINKKQVKGVI